jgi:hypothetical protein
MMVEFHDGLCSLVDLQHSLASRILYGTPKMWEHQTSHYLPFLGIDQLTKTVQSNYYITASDQNTEPD